jgi:hypothetical protein
MVTTRARRKAGLGAFYIGMSLIGAAVVLNIAYDRLSWAGPEVMPYFLTHMYESSGKTNVTLAFVAFGLSVMFLGLALPKGADEKAADEEQTESKLPLVAPEDESAGAPSSDVAPNGQVILRTQQYMRRKGKSGK